MVDAVLCAFKFDTPALECLCGEAGATLLVDTFYVGTGDGMPCRGKIAPYSGETFSLFCLIIALWNYRDQP